ncbi:MAG TPA: M20/M25/M40 family metallo-hydrolase [Steroidobacteraceae bacterium]|nr:M20/M25/M40 family metallo-hydrolase [Steroidobacteraceae bacterium]
MSSRTAATLIVALLGATALPAVRAAGADRDAAWDALAREIFAQLIEIDTTDPHGNVTTAAEAMARRFLDAGFAPADVRVLGGNERKKNLVVRVHGSGGHQPVLLMGHLDVVDARREDWSTDPFKFVEKDGYFYGRGTSDMKDGDAIMATTLIRMKKEGYRPSRDLILILTADEEGGCCNGVSWLLKNQRGLVDAEFALNHDGNSIMSEHGVPQVFELGATEKVYADYQLVVTDRGGHSSLPRPDNAIYELARDLLRIARFQFPFELNNVTRAYYERMAQIETGERAADMRAILADPPEPLAIARLSRDPIDHSTTRTTCVATRLSGGHANNALPQRAEALINCRILPGHSPEAVRQQLVSVAADPKVTVNYIADDGTASGKAPEHKGAAPPPPVPEVGKPLEQVVAAMWPGLRVVPTMDPGASDGVYTDSAGIPTYDVSGVAIDRDDIRMHGRDERVGVESFYKANEFFYRYLEEITAH